MNKLNRCIEKYLAANNGSGSFTLNVTGDAIDTWSVNIAEPTQAQLDSYAQDLADDDVFNAWQSDMETSDRQVANLSNIARFMEDFYNANQSYLDNKPQDFKDLLTYRATRRSEKP